MSRKFRRMWTVLATAAATVGLTAALTAPAQAGPLYNQYINYKADKCLSIEGGGSTANGANVVLYTCNGGHEQDWGYVSQTDGTYTYFFLINRKSGKCMSVSGGGSTAKGAEIIQWSCNDMTEQQWRIVDDRDWPLIDGSYAKVLINRKSGLILSTPGGAWANNTKIIQWSYLKNASEQHYLIS